MKRPTPSDRPGDGPARSARSRRVSGGALQAPREAVQDLALFGGGQVAAELGGQVAQALLGVAQGEAGLGGRVGDGQLAAAVAREDLLQGLGGGWVLGCSRESSGKAIAGRRRVPPGFATGAGAPNRRRGAGQALAARRVLRLLGGLPGRRTATGRRLSRSLVPSTQSISGKCHVEVHVGHAVQAVMVAVVAAHPVEQARRPGRSAAGSRRAGGKARAGPRR